MEYFVVYKDKKTRPYLPLRPNKFMTMCNGWGFYLKVKLPFFPQQRNFIYIAYEMVFSVLSS